MFFLKRQKNIHGKVSTHVLEGKFRVLERQLLFWPDKNGKFKFYSAVFLSYGRMITSKKKKLKTMLCKKIYLELSVSGLLVN